MSEVVFDEIKL